MTVPLNALNSHHHKNKNADVAEHLEVFRHVGLLFNEPSSTAGLLFT
jgi:hypothetical protein